MKNNTKVETNKLLDAVNALLIGVGYSPIPGNGKHYKAFKAFISTHKALWEKARDERVLDYISYMEKEAGEVLQNTEGADVQAGRDAQMWGHVYEVLSKFFKEGKE